MSVVEDMVELCDAAFRFAKGHAEIVRLALAHSLLERDAVPAVALRPEKTCRCFPATRKLMEEGLADGTFRRELDAGQLTLGFVGLVRSHLMARLANPRHPLTRRTAEALVALFLAGARAAKPRTRRVARCPLPDRLNGATDYGNR